MLTYDAIESIHRLSELYPTLQILDIKGFGPQDRSDGHASYSLVSLLFTLFFATTPPRGLFLVVSSHALDLSSCSVSWILLLGFGLSLKGWRWYLDHVSCLYCFYRQSVLPLILFHSDGADLYRTIISMP